MNTSKAPDKIYLTPLLVEGCGKILSRRVTKRDEVYIREDALVNWIKAIRTEYDTIKLFDRGADSAMEHVLERIASL